MKNSLVTTLSCAAVLAACALFTAHAQNAKMSVEDSVLVSMTGTVTDVNVENCEITLTVRARDVGRLEKLRLGDTIVVTFTEALPVSLEKVKKQKRAS